MIDINDLMKQAQSMQGKMAEDLKKMRVEGSSGGEMVKVVLNGQKELTNIEIQPQALEDPELLSDLVLSAMNSAYQKIDQQIPNNMGDMLKNVDLSQISKLFQK